MTDLTTKVLISAIILYGVLMPTAKAMCPNPRQIMNGRWNSSFRRHQLEIGARWQFTCFPGFTLTGSSSMYCMQNGQWSADVPTCKRGGGNGHLPNRSGHGFCSFPGQIVNGRWEASYTDNYLENGAVWTFQCYNGYFLHGSSSITCNQGTWTSAVPKCTRGGGSQDGPTIKTAPNSFCPNLQLPPFSKATLFFKSQSLEIGTRLVLSCYDGFNLVGNSEITCQANGKWSGQLPQCVDESQSSVDSVNAVCEDPGMRQNSRRVSYFTNHALEAGARFVFTCSEGYVMQGSETTTCQQNGVWSSPVPRCIHESKVPETPTSITITAAFCQDPGTPPGARRVSQFTKNELETGARMVFSCDDGLTIQGTDTTTCLDTGLWSSPVPKCLPESKGPDVSTSVTITAAFCQDPGTPPGARRVSQFTKNELETGARMVFSCDDGLTMQGSDTTTCLNTGLWSSPVPKCLPDGPEFPVNQVTTSITLFPGFCEDPGLPPSARRVAYFTRNELETGAKMVFTCNEGFKMEGGDTTVCLPTNLWSSPVPKCLREDIDPGSPTKVSAYPTLDTICEDPGRPANSVRTPNRGVYALGSVVNFTCKSGFGMQGGATVVCMYSGKWSSAPPECISTESKDGCKEPEPPQNGKLSVIIDRVNSNAPIKLTVGSKIQYACDKAYHLDGSETRMCLSDGRWSGTAPRCVINCGSSKSTQRPLIINGEVSKIGEWPWQAGVAIAERSLAQLTEQTNNISFKTQAGNFGIVCGGSLISDEWILTAAHCTTNPRTSEKFPIEDISVYLGKHYRDPAEDDDFVQWSRVTDVTIHEDFDRSKFVADIAMIRMEKLAKFSERVLPICLPSSRPDRVSAVESGAKGVVSGWGTTEGNIPSVELKHGELAFTAPQECEKLSPGQSPTSVSRVQPDQFCAKAISLGSGYSCFGDSGGPLVYEDTVGNKKRWVIEGIVSWGQNGCAISSSVYIRVNFYLNWLRRFINIDDHNS